MADRKPAELGRAIRLLLVTFGILTALAVTVLYVEATGTEAHFAWTIQPPITAAFLGTGYGAGLAAVLLSLRIDAWEPVRLGLQAILVFVVMTTVATLMHLDKFHLGAGGMAGIAAWLWLGVYVVVPVWILALLRAHRGSDRASDAPSRWPVVATIALWVQAAVLAALGLALLVGPASADQLWPWELTALTARAVAAWLLCMATAGIILVRDRSDTDLRVPMAVYTAFPALAGIALMRFRDQVTWDGSAAVLLVTLLAVMLATGVYGLAPAGHRPPATSTDAGHAGG